MTDPDQGALQIAPARDNHSIWTAPPKAMSHVTASSVESILGKPSQAANPTVWAVMDEGSGAHIKLWKIGEPDGGEPFYVAWIDHPKRPGTGRQLAEVVAGEHAGAVLEML